MSISYTDPRMFVKNLFFTGKLYISAQDLYKKCSILIPIRSCIGNETWEPKLKAITFLIASYKIAKTQLYDTGRPRILYRVQNLGEKCIAYTNHISYRTFDKLNFFQNFPKRSPLAYF